MSEADAVPSDDECVCGRPLGARALTCSAACRRRVFAALRRLDRRHSDERRRERSRGTYEAPLGQTAIGVSARDDREAAALHLCAGDFRGLEALAEVTLAHDPFTRMHLLHVNRLAERWSHALELDEPRKQVLLQAALLHDVGKLGIPSAILLKPSELTTQEFATMMQHVAFGANMLESYPRLRNVARIVGQHHERFDGGGYPNALRGEGIDELARAVSIIDAFSAMTLDRPYHRAVSEDEALIELERCAGSQFDPVLVKSFVGLRRGAEPPQASARTRD